MLGGITGWHFLIILVIVLLLFGATRLPALARSLGQSMNAFKAEMKPKDGEAPKAESTGEASTTTSADTTPKP
ncbi:twin-arginine translocase TatA/TatE family subunit [Galbitalea soli]|uniref:Sec-independent protein translocase protein TatA n=1 Tax=Galbitalea soli TaxID=1268042 RepID=A0A7C9PL57_9MICO|nr:twin-arginine translocase TatA/TatE family subunit [Galbitalea soli]NEM90053.1 twin-arginine translocase TatA/TatE family subunit [Galbitalea soli]NYJ30760.1 sec-independent protein translocase protein TatA [Galbitalea soli]